MDKYLPRLIDKTIENTLQYAGAILIVGPKWCGKTTSAGRIAKSILKMQDPDKMLGYLTTAETKPSLLLIGEKPRLIDEWQMAPVLWDAVRNSVDIIGKPGQYILTGSTCVNKEKIMHSGTGRFTKLVMYPMSLYESKESNGKISLKQLFNNKNLDIDGIKSDLSIENLIKAACRGGWPSSLNISEKFNLKIAKSYVDNICDIDCSNIDGIKRDRKRMMAIIKSYARNISTLANDQSILKDLISNDSTMNIQTLKSYLSALEKLFVIEEVEAWHPNIRSASAIRSSKKREFVDPSIAAAALNLTPEFLMQDLNTFGFIFENLCIRDLRIYSNNLGGEISYYHDKYGLEADCVLHLDDGRYALIEFKLGTSQIEMGAKHLLELKHLIKKANEESHNINLKESDLLIIITGGEMAYTRDDGVKIIPIGCLKN